MHLLFETRLDILRVSGDVQFFQREPVVTPEPVLRGDAPADARGASIYGSVLRDGGVLRMWYQAWPDGDESEQDSAAVAYAESDDGITWRKPKLGLVEHSGSKANNLTDMGVHTPSVFIDPHAPPSHRYRGTGAIDSRYAMKNPDADAPLAGGYYTLHSADGLHWELDSKKYRWANADNIYTIWHPGRDEALALMKVQREYRGIGRRSWASATMRGGAWSDFHLAIVPDDFADVAAIARGQNSTDYYGVGLMPAGPTATVGFLLNFHHRLPLRVYEEASPYGNLGFMETTLVYQSEPMACWQHAPGRTAFIRDRQIPWATDSMYIASNVIDVGNEQRLYLCGTTYGHNRAYQRPSEDGKIAAIGYASWPTNRLFGFRSERYGEINLDLGVITRPSQLVLNCETESDGQLRVSLRRIPTRECFIFAAEDLPGRGKDDAVPLTGDKLAGVAAWKDGPLIAPSNGDRIVARIHLDWAKVYAFEVRPLG